MSGDCAVLLQLWLLRDEKANRNWKGNSGQISLNNRHGETGRKPGLCMAEAPICAVKLTRASRAARQYLGQGEDMVAAVLGSGAAALPKPRWDALVLMFPVSTCVLALEGVCLESLIHSYS